MVPVVSVMLIPVAVIAPVIVISTVMPPVVSSVMIRLGIIIETYIRIDDINPEIPAVSRSKNRPVEILHSQKPYILAAGQHPAEIVIAQVEHIVIVFQRPGISGDHIVHEVTDIINEIKIDLIDILHLPGRQVQFVCHPVCQETGVFTHFSHTHGGHAYRTHSNQPDGNNQ